MSVLRKWEVHASSQLLLFVVEKPGWFGLGSHQHAGLVLVSDVNLKKQKTWARESSQTFMTEGRYIFINLCVWLCLPCMEAASMALHLSAWVMLSLFWGGEGKKESIRISKVKCKCSNRENNLLTTEYIRVEVINNPPGSWLDVSVRQSLTWWWSVTFWRVARRSSDPCIFVPFPWLLSGPQLLIDGR